MNNQKRTSGAIEEAIELRRKMAEKKTWFDENLQDYNGFI